MDTVNIRLTIARAVADPGQTAALARHLQTRLGCLHRTIHLQGVDAVQTLLEFVVGYTERVPEFLDALNSIGRSAHCSEFIEPLIAISTEFFEQPPELLNGHDGLLALMDEAYLAHRLIEEVNGHFIAQCGDNLVPMDMTRSNLIMHHLIGEPFANQLDEAIRLVVDRLETEHLFIVDGRFNPELRREFYWGTEGNHWPCFTDTLSINLFFGVNPEPDVIH